MNTASYLIAFCSALALVSCNGAATSVGPPGTSTTVVGETKPLGSGTVSTFAQLDAAGMVTAIGATFGAAALTGLPATMTETVVALPAAAVSAGPYTVFAANWNPMGHPPPAIYTVPHFDFHFYMISDATRMAIAGGPVTSPPPAAAVPPDYVGDPVTVPMMGQHFTDSKASEFTGQPFTATLVYGYYGGKMAFVEPMIALSYLNAKQTYSAAIKQPATYPAPGLYPTHYAVSFDAASNTYTVTLDGLVRH